MDTGSCLYQQSVLLGYFVTDLIQVTRVGTRKESLLPHGRQVVGVPLTEYLSDVSKVSTHPCLSRVRVWFSGYQLYGCVLRMSRVVGMGDKRP